MAIIVDIDVMLARRSMSRWLTGCIARPDRHRIAI